MPRKPRFFVPDVPLHIVVRGNDRRVVFAEEEDRRAYLGWLGEALREQRCELHAYVLMDNHVHLLLRSARVDGPSKLMQAIGRKYVPYFNRKYGKSGTLWEGRFKASLVQDEHYVLACYRYIELNPVRAGMVNHPSAYGWSSYAANGLGEADRLVMPHPVYLALARDKMKRACAYRSGFEQTVAPGEVAAIRAAVQTGTPLGNDRFREEVERLLGRRVGYAKRGRPRRNKKAHPGDRR